MEEGRIRALRWDWLPHAAVLFSLLGAAPAGRAVAQAPGPPPPPTGDTVSARRDSLMREVLRSIAGRENAPAESVFQNLKVLRGMPASRIPRMMNVGFGRSLGVSCDHCHVVGEWERDDKPKKEVARQMWSMMGKINGELLPGIDGLESQRPAVNCTTCHRGAVKPALDLPPQ